MEALKEAPVVRNEIERFGREFNYPKESRVKSNADLPKLG